jgi:nitrate reductase NapAB chaperone NapD
MRARRSWPVLLGTLALTGQAAPADAQPIGSEFQINTYTTSNQVTGFGSHEVAADANGNFVVVWYSQGQDASGYGVFGQRYDSAGAALGSEFRVNSWTTDSQRAPSVAAAADGAFVVVWESNRQDGSATGVFGQRYDSGGRPVGREFRVNTTRDFRQEDPSVASDVSGNFVVVWTGSAPSASGEVFGQRFDSAGERVGGEFRVNTTTNSFQGFSSVASDASGNFVVVWESYYQEGDYLSIFGQRYDSAGGRQGGEFRVNSYTSGSQLSPSVAADAGGDFVVVWMSGGQDGSSYGIFGQRYDSSGVPQADEFAINTYTTDLQRFPDVASDASGNFVVVWESQGQDGDDAGTFGQRYNSEGIAQGDEFPINTHTTRDQGSPFVGATGTNQFVVAWDSSYQDGSGSGVFGQRFDFGAVHAITVVSPNRELKWRIGSQERIQWRHNLGADAIFRIELDRDDDGVYEELIAADTPADSATRGHFAWIVTGPASGTARVRVSWTEDPAVSDSSDVTFQIRPVPLAASRQE